MAAINWGSRDTFEPVFSKHSGKCLKRECWVIKNYFLIFFLGDEGTDNVLVIPCQLVPWEMQEPEDVVPAKG